MTRYQLDTLRSVEVGTTGTSAATTVSNGSNLRDVRTSSQNYWRRRKSMVLKGAKGKPSETVPRLCSAGSRSGGTRVRMKEGHRSRCPPEPTLRGLRTHLQRPQTPEPHAQVQFPATG